DIAAVDIQHLGRFHEGVAQVFVPRVERVVDLEATPRFAEKAGDADLAVEDSGEAVGVFPDHSARVGVGGSGKPSHAAASAFALYAETGEAESLYAVAENAFAKSARGRLRRKV